MSNSPFDENIDSRSLVVGSLLNGETITHCDLNNEPFIVTKHSDIAEYGEHLYKVDYIPNERHLVRVRLFPMDWK